MHGQQESLQETILYERCAMFRIEQLKLPIKYTEHDLIRLICKELRITQTELVSYRIIRRSLDARKKTEIHYSFLVDVEVSNEKKILKLLPKLKRVSVSTETKYEYRITGTEKMKERPVVVGAGPAGLFCAYFLAKSGYKPILIERGDTIENRTTKVERFWKDNTLDVESNVQFGEGGAGTYSDGKLNTMVKDTYGRIREVLNTFVQFGAPEEIMYVNKPHIGTDKLRYVITNMREEIERLGGTCLFRTKLTGFQTDVNRGIQRDELSAVVINETEPLPCNTLVLALGHSARDTFEMLYKNKLKMEKKAFAVGVRVEHPQSLINENQFGEQHRHLPAADYKLTHTTKSGRGIYSFCMCPGGFVVNASSEEGRLAVNGMSNYDRAERNANSAIVVTVTPEDFNCLGTVADTPLAGVEFQRQLETLAYRAGNGAIPVQLYQDFIERKASSSFGKILPNTKGACKLSDLHNCLPDFVCEQIVEGMPEFAKRIPGFDMPDVLLEGVESRTSSPLRILRDENLESNVAGIYPCGEGAGYAGGIVSAAADGLRVFEAIIKKYRP